jgi:1,2-diacylglycerol 3-beta-galactosyltransferase
MCLMSDTGGGHRASATALRDGFEVLYGDKYEINVVDLWSSSSPWPLCNMPKSYFFLVKYPWLWRLSFRTSEPELLHEAMFTGYTAIVGRRFARAFQEYKPDLIVSVHPLMQHVPLKVLARMRALPDFDASRTPFATVVTDLTRCHRTWFHKQVDRCFVATQLVAAQAMQCGLKAKQLACHGLPIRPSFMLAPRPKDEIRADLGMDEEARTVMLVGGGEGMGKLEATAEALAATLEPEDQVLVICGKNQKLARQLAARRWPVKMVVRGFVNNMNEYMSACDCVITKAGPGTIAEALISGLPVLLNGFIPCQEAGNVSFVLENGVGAYEEEPAKMAEIVREWFQTEGALEEMSRRAKRLGRPEATFNIVRELAGMAR